MPHHAHFTQEEAEAPRLKGDSLQGPEPGGEKGRQCDLCGPEPPAGALRKGRGDHPALMWRGHQA